MTSTFRAGTARGAAFFGTPLGALLLLTSLGTTGLHLVVPLGSGWGVASNLVGYGAATALAWLGAATAPAARHRAVARRLATGITLYTTANLVYTGLGWVTGEPPDTSIADAIWAAAYVTTGAAILGFGGSGRRALNVDTLVDTLVGAVVGTLVVWELSLAELINTASVPAFTRVVWGTYPAGDVILLALLVRVLLDPTRTRSTSLVVMAAGVGGWLVVDMAWLTVGSVERWVSAGWMATLTIVACATAFDHHRTERPMTDERHLGYLRARMWLVLVPLVLPPLLQFRAHLTHSHADPRPHLVATAALIVLAGVRVHRLLREAADARLEVRRSEQHFRALADNSADAVVVLDERGCVQEGAGNLGRLLGVGPEQIVGVRVVEAEAVGDRRAVTALLAKALSSPGTVLEEEVQVADAGGRERWLAARAVNLLANPAVEGIVVNLQDVTDRKRAEQELTRQAFHDVLTGLANRALFMDRASQALRRTGRTGMDPAIAFVDVDGFKSINDRFGHEAGDRLLQEIASRLQSAVRASDTVARLGGDEFAVLIEDNHLEADEAVTTAERILQALSVPLEVEGQLVGVSGSVGLAVAEADSTADSLLRSADIAMYRAKAAGKARVVLYDAAMGTEEGEVVELQADLTGALERGEMELHYQPVVQLTDGRVVGFEALLRWRHPRLGLVAPDRFIPLAEQTGLIVPIGRWVLDTACATAARWTGTGGDDGLTMAVNLSGRQLERDDVLDDVRGALVRSGLDPTHLVLEITESTLVEEPDAAARRLRTLSDLGVRLAIDDFGTGYSSLSYLRKFPIDILKIDRSFIETITETRDVPPIVRGLLDLGHTLDLEIVAEGIELDVQREGLKGERRVLGQGFLFSRPLPAAEAERLVGRSDVATEAG